jgi:hypothetical protein
MKDVDLTDKCMTFTGLTRENSSKTSFVSSKNKALGHVFPETLLWELNITSEVAKMCSFFLAIKMMGQDLCQ